MPDRPCETALLQAVELLMGQFSEQILALLEAHARGDVEAEAFEARIRELVGAVSPEAVARHPGRLALVRPAPSPPAPQPTPAVPAVEPAPAPEPDVAAAPEAAPCLELEVPSLVEPAAASEPPAAPEAAPVPELEISPLPATPGPPAVPEPAPESPAILDGVTGFEPLPDYEWEALPAEPEPEAVPEPDVFAAPEPDVAAAPEAAPCLELEIPSLVEPAAASEPPAAPGAAPDPELKISPLPATAAASGPPAEPAPAPESPAILDGVSGFEPLPDYGWEALLAEPEPEAVPEPDVFAAPEPDVAAAPEAAPCLELEIPSLVEPAAAPEPPAAPEAAPVPELEISPLPATPEPPAEPAPAPESPAILDGVSGYEHLLDAEFEESSPPPAAAQAAASSVAPRPAPPKAGPAAPARPRKSPPKDVAAAPSTPSRTPAARPAAPAKPAPRPEAPPAPEQASAPAKPAAASGQPSAGPAKAPPPCRIKPTGMGGNVVVTGRTGGDDLKRPDRPSMGFGDQMFGNRDKEEVGDHATTFVSRQVRRGLQDKATWKSPAKAALLSGLLPGVGDFYLGKVGNGLVFYLVFYILLMLLILRGDLILAGVWAVVAIVSSGMSWLGAQKHNEAIHRIKDAPNLQKKTRETTFTFDSSRRRR